MDKSLSKVLAIVEYLIEQGDAFEDAVKKAGAPPEHIEYIRESLQPPFDFNLATGIVDNQSNYILFDEADIESLRARPYFDFYHSALIQKKWKPKNIRSIEKSAMQIMSRLPDPGKNESFSSKGLVVGHVQSGKTANMSAVLTQAVDLGYKLVIVFAGLYNDLRFQTQVRMDNDITGACDDDENRQHNLTHDPKTPSWDRWTKDFINGDFGVHMPSWSPDANSPILIVAKKRPSKIREIVKHISSARGVDLKDFPALIIDDEADLASIDTNYHAAQVDDSESPAETNGAIRELIECFPKVAYIGYTATPFANLVIDAEVPGDLYPKDFIYVLDEPVEYFGPRQLFGLGMQRSTASPEEEEEWPELDIGEILTDQEISDLNGASVQSSEELSPLARAIDYFALSCCARIARGEKGHFSMLIHPSHLKKDHSVFVELSKRYIDDILKLQFKYKEKKPYQDLNDRYKRYWIEKFVPVTQSLEDESLPVLDFDNVWGNMGQFLDEVDIILANSDSDIELKYPSETPKTYIVVGGNKLSRGLTLEGLSISLFFRNSPNQYDTLMQMGRWFGYRKGYQDLTKIMIDQVTFNNFRDMSRIMLELKSDLKKYSEEKPPVSPLEIFPKIRAHPALRMTSRLKMGAARQVNLSLQHQTVQTIKFPRDQRTLENNLRLAKAWVSGLGDFEEAGGAFYRKDLSAREVLGFLADYVFSESATQVKREEISQYIQQQNNIGELTQWDLILPKGSSKEGLVVWKDGLESLKVSRSSVKKYVGSDISIKVLTTPKDLSDWRSVCGRSVNDAEIGGLFLYVIDKDSGKNTKSGVPIFTDPTNATDVLGIAVQFPRSSSVATAEYISQG